MPIIQYVLPSRNKQIKKMLAFYWESVPPRPRPGRRPCSRAVRLVWPFTDPVAPLPRVCPKLDENGKLKQEMILVW